jgi:hypothetical protein
MQHPLSEKALTKARSKAAKRGLPENLMQFMEAKRQSMAGIETPPEASGPEAERVRKVRRRFSPKKME